MPYDPEIHHRRSIRLRGYDYSQSGSYSVTICTEGKVHVFGQVVEGEMYRNELGDCIAKCWKWLAQQYSYIDLDEWTVMPNHLHGIIVITDRGGGGSRCDRDRSPSAQTLVGALREAPSGQSPAIAGEGGSRSAPTKRKTLGSLVGVFKTVSTEDINELRGTPTGPLWQRDFYDHIVRDEDELNKIREYIRTNPLRWESDPDFTEGIS